MRKKLPILLSHPHAGLDAPPEIQTNLAIDETTIYNEADLWTDRLFDFSHPDLLNLEDTQINSIESLATVSTPIARVLIDVNRPLSRLDHPDGPVKTRTSYGETIYKEPIDVTMQQHLLKRYWSPYYKEFEQALYDGAGQIKLMIDCHNMAQIGPTAYYDAQQPRPLICIGNWGDEQGEPKPERGWTFCPGWFARATVEIAQEVFSDLPLLEPDERNPAVPIATLNSPFSGSYIFANSIAPEKAESYKIKTGFAPPPSFMVEVNRGLFVGNQTEKTTIQPPNQERISEVRKRLYKWITQVLDLL